MHYVISFLIKTLPKVVYLRPEVEKKVTLFCIISILGLLTHIYNFLWVPFHIEINFLGMALCFILCGKYSFPVFVFLSLPLTCRSVSVCVCWPGGYETGALLDSTVHMQTENKHLNLHQCCFCAISSLPDHLPLPVLSMPLQ